MNFKDVGGYLRSVRLEQGKTMRQVAEGAGLDISKVSMLETGKNQNPTFPTIYKVACALGLQMTILFSELERSKEEKRKGGKKKKITG